MPGASRIEFAGNHYRRGNKMASVSMFQPGYLSMDRAAKYASVSTKTIKRWIQGGFPVYQGTVRGKVLIRPSDIDGYLSRRQASKIDLYAMVQEVITDLSSASKAA